MGILWKHLWGRVKRRLNYADLEAIFRFYSAAAARNEPLSTYVARIRESDPARDPFSELESAVEPRLRRIADEKNRGDQARECRALLLEYVERAASDHYIALKADKTLREVVLLAITEAEGPEEIERRECEMLWSYVNALWNEVTISCLYEEQFNSYMPTDHFRSPYRAMTEMYTRLLCAKLFGKMLAQHGSSEQRRVSDLYEEACSDSHIAELAEIKSNYCNAVKSGVVDELYPLQEHFAKRAQSVQESVKEVFNRPCVTSSNEASGLARRVFPVWAAQGPFDSGEESAAAMRYAYLAVFGPEEAERMGMVGAIAKHAAAYDSDPAAWEKNRQEAILSANSETEEFVTVAKGLAAMDSLNKVFLESGGHKLELARQSDGSLGIAYKKIWSDEAIEEKKKQGNDAVVSGIGKGLLSDTSEEARALVAFLAEVYKANTGEEIVSQSAIGRAWFACLEIKNEDPDSDLAQEFERLNEAHQAILESTEGTLPWSSNPGAHESHLMRRHNNPYFPESRRSVSHEDLAEAKRKDKEDYILCLQNFEQLGNEIEALPRTSTSGDLLALRERIDDLIFFSMGMGGPAVEIASKADQLRESVISDLRAAFSGDEETLNNIDKADTYHKDNVRKFYIPVVAQILRKNSPIPQEETIPTILSEDPSAIAIFINSLPEDSRALIEVEGLKMLRETLNEGHVDPQCEEKIFALGGEWPIQKT